MMVRYGDVNLVTSYGKEMMMMEIGGLCVMGATKSTISSVVELIMLRKIITALILKLIPSIVKHALNSLFTCFITIILLQPHSQGFFLPYFLKLSDLKIRREEALQRGYFVALFLVLGSNFEFLLLHVFLPVLFP